MQFSQTLQSLGALTWSASRAWYSFIGYYNLVSGRHCMVQLHWVQVAWYSFIGYYTWPVSITNMHARAFSLVVFSQKKTPVISNESRSTQWPKSDSWKRQRCRTFPASPRLRSVFSRMSHRSVSGLRPAVQAPPPINSHFLSRQRLKRRIQDKPSGQLQKTSSHKGGGYMFIVHITCNNLVLQKKTPPWEEPEGGRAGERRK